MSETKYNVHDIFNELENLNIWERFCEWRYSIYPSLHNSQQALMYCYEVFKLNESYFIEEWKRGLNENRE